MSEGILFGVGFIIFVATTTATLLFGYFQFNRLYREDRAAGPSAFGVGTDESGLEIQTAGDRPDDARTSIARRPRAALAVSIRSPG